MHPKREDLIGFLLGTLPADSADSLAEHLVECDKCEATIAELEGACDTVVERLRSNVQPDPFEQEDGCQKMLQAIEAFGQGSALTAPSGANGPHIALEQGTIREYKLLSKLGEGGMGTVYKALHTKLDKMVALKVLPPQRTKDAEAVARFEREMRAVGRLDHPHIVRAMDAGEVNGRHFLVMEYVQGADLSQLVKQHGPLPIADACELVRQGAMGLAEAHDHEMVHRDIKPSNLILAERRRKPPVVKILDMGLALLSEPHAADAEGLTSTGQTMGTLDYMAPEQGDDTHAVDIRADIYSLGATLYNLLCGQAPFAGRKYDTPVKKLMALATEAPQPIGDQRVDLPLGLAQVVHKMLAKNPDERYGTPDEVAAALAPFTAGSNLTALVGFSRLSPAKKQATSQQDTSPSGFASIPPTSTLRMDVGKRAQIKRPRWQIYVIAVCAAMLSLLGAIFFTIRTPTGTVQFRLSDPNADVSIQVDGDRIDVDAEDRHYEFKVGPHTFTVSGEDFETVSDKFQIRRGDNPPIDITLVKRVGGQEAVAQPSFPTVAPGQLPPGLEGAFQILTADSDQHGNPIRTGTDTKTGWPLEIHHLRSQMPFVFIPAGEFLMGCAAQESAQPIHKVRLTKPFYLGKYEVTQAEWVALMDDNPSRFKEDNHPVESVRWRNCNVFAKQLDLQLPSSARRADLSPVVWEFALPTEAQWEYACRAGTQTRFYFGDFDDKLGEYAWFSGNSGQWHHPVGQKKPNPWGLYDMHGNIREWCREFPRKYTHETQVDPTGPENPEAALNEGKSRVERGGNWGMVGVQLQAGYRILPPSNFFDHKIGCRVCLEPTLTSGPGRSETDDRAEDNSDHSTQP